ncbi:MAG: DNA repair and recombination protein RadB [Methanosarcinales archaeon]
MNNNKIKKISSGCQKIDDILGGGFERGVVTQIYGEAGTGKTNMCMQLAIECIKNGNRVIFIDTEGFSPERFSQIAGSNAKEFAQKIIMYEPMSFEQQYSIIKELNKIMEENIGLIIFDSATLFYRFELDDEKSIALRRELANQIGHLHLLARKYNIAVVITSQVYTDIDTQEFYAVGGSMIDHLSKVIIQFEKIGTGKRRATIRKHRSRPEGISCEFMITQQGIR